MKEQNDRALIIIKGHPILQVYFRHIPVIWNYEGWFASDSSFAVSESKTRNPQRRNYGSQSQFCLCEKHWKSFLSVLCLSFGFKARPEGKPITEHAGWLHGPSWEGCTHPFLGVGCQCQAHWDTWYSRIEELSYIKYRNGYSLKTWNLV